MIDWSFGDERGERMKKLGLLTTSILLTLSLAMYSRYFSDSGILTQKNQIIRRDKPIAFRRRGGRSLHSINSQVIYKLCLSLWTKNCQ